MMIHQNTQQVELNRLTPIQIISRTKLVLRDFGHHRHYINRFILPKNTKAQTNITKKQEKQSCTATDRTPSADADQDQNQTRNDRNVKTSRPRLTGAKVGVGLHSSNN